jgi:hypothetical protein
LALPSPVAVAVAVPVGSPLVKLALASAVPVEVLTEALDELVNPVPVTPLTLVVALAYEPPLLAVAEVVWAKPGPAAQKHALKATAVAAKRADARIKTVSTRTLTNQLIRYQLFDIGASLI